MRAEAISPPPRRLPISRLHRDPASRPRREGTVEERREVWGDARWMPRDNVDLSAGVGFRRVRNETNVADSDREAWLARFTADVRY